jgi:uracil-DNA glycosylase
MQLHRSVFDDETKIATIPMGFCYPGASEHGGDNPPRPECAPLWHEQLLSYLPDVQLILLVGQYAQRRYLGSGRKRSMTETVRAFSQYGPKFFPLPHPSWRSTIWMRKHLWFEETIIPQLRTTVRKVLATD